MNIVEKISEYHDIQVQEWADELVHLIEKPSQDVSVLGQHHKNYFISTVVSVCVCEEGESKEI